MIPQKNPIAYIAAFTRLTQGACQIHRKDSQGLGDSRYDILKQHKEKIHTEWVQVNLYINTQILTLLMLRLLLSKAQGCNDF